MSKSNSSAKGTIGRIFGKPLSDWLGVPGTEFRDGLARMFSPSTSPGQQDRPSQVDGQPALPPEEPYKIQREFLNFEKREESRMLKGRLDEVDVNLREEQVRSISLDNAMKELQLVLAMREAGVEPTYANGRITFLYTEPVNQLESKLPQTIDEHKQHEIDSGEGPSGQ